VGNGGFSLRSRRLLMATQHKEFIFHRQEDIAICVINKAMLEEKFDIRFATEEVAKKFSFEHYIPDGKNFGFHGIWNIIYFMNYKQVFHTLLNSPIEFLTFERLIRILINVAKGKNRFSKKLLFSVVVFKFLLYASAALLKKVKK
jgi:hypothetical protein